MPMERHGHEVLVDGGSRRSETSLQTAGNRAGELRVPRTMLAAAPGAARVEVADRPVVRRPLTLFFAAWILYALGMVGASMGPPDGARLSTTERSSALARRPGGALESSVRPREKALERSEAMRATAPRALETATEAGGPTEPASPVEPPVARGPRPSVVSLAHPWNSVAGRGKGAVLFPVELKPDGPNPTAEIEPKRVRVGDRAGRTIIARVYGPAESGIVLLPDGQLGWPNRMIYTDEPFRPLSPQEMIDQLRAGQFAEFESLQTQYYVILYQSSRRFAEQSGKLLDSLYDGLLSRFRASGFNLHESEFPLVAVIFENEEDFRAHREIDSDIQAYYEVVSNRIYFYETRQKEEEDPQLAAMRKPQTVAHEGTHQILHNIGVQPRLSDWPPWVVEGLAELAAAPRTRNGEWAGFSQGYPTHIATLEDMQDSIALQGRAARLARVRVGQAPGRSRVEYIITRDRLTPTDYALSWALTHFLANKRTQEFLAYLKELGQRPPGKKRDPTEELARFHRHFGGAPRAMEPEIASHLRKLRSQTPLVYYAVLFEQPLPGNLVRRGTLVSRSPQLIREWIEERMPDPHGGAYTWRIVPFQNRQQAFIFTEQWVNSW
jgi:hypothetical protein